MLCEEDFTPVVKYKLLFFNACETKWISRNKGGKIKS